MKKEPLIYIEHILNCIDNIQTYSKGLTREMFDANQMVQDAIIRNFEIIGEATKNISKDFKQKHPDVAWRNMGGNEG